MARSHRDQARLRRGRLRRLHGPSRRRAGRELPPAGESRRAARRVTTVEGIGAGKLHPVQRAFMAPRRAAMRVLHPGLHRRSERLPRRLARRARRRDADARGRSPAALSGHLCRCGAYDNIFRAVADACSGRYDGDAERSPRVEARRESDRRGDLHRRRRHDGQLEGVVLRSPHARARVGSIDLEPARASRASPRPFPSSTTTAWSSSSASRSPRSRPRSQDRARRAGRDQVDYEILPSVDRAGGRAREGRRRRSFSPRQGAEVQRRRRRGRAGLLARQCPRTDRARSLKKNSARARKIGRALSAGARSAPVRRDVPDRGPAAHLSRAACRGRPFRWRRS